MLSVVFDMDGVIFDTEVLCRRAWHACSGKYGVTDVDSLLAFCIGGNQERMVQVLKHVMGEDFPALDFLEDARREIRRLWDEEGIPVKKGAKEILDWLKQQNAVVGLASSTEHDTVVSQLGNAGLLDYFQAVVGGDQITRSKPDPEIYQKACRKLGICPEDAYAVEDSYNGVRSASNAGMRTIMVPDLLPPTGEMEKLAYRILPDLFCVKELFAESM